MCANVICWKHKQNKTKTRNNNTNNNCKRITLTFVRSDTKAYIHTARSRSFVRFASIKSSMWICRKKIINHKKAQQPIDFAVWVSECVPLHLNEYIYMRIIYCCRSKRTKHLAQKNGHQHNALVRFILFYFMSIFSLWFSLYVMFACVRTTWLCLCDEHQTRYRYT